MSVQTNADEAEKRMLRERGVQLCSRRMLRRKRRRQNREMQPVLESTPKRDKSTVQKILMRLFYKKKL